MAKARAAVASHSTAAAASASCFAASAAADNAAFPNALQFAPATASQSETSVSSLEAELVAFAAVLAPCSCAWTNLVHRTFLMARSVPVHGELFFQQRARNDVDFTHAHDLTPPYAPSASVS
jgi:hypothetical protein